MATEAFVPTREREVEDRGMAAPDPPLVGPDGKPTAAGWRRISVRLQDQMPTKTRKGGGGRTFDYITARQVQDRLDRVVGPGNWQTVFQVIDLAERVVQCTLIIFDVSKTDVGYSNNPDSDHETEPLKAAYSDAFKRAAVHFGIGRWLYGDL